VVLVFRGWGRVLPGFFCAQPTCQPAVAVSSPPARSPVLAVYQVEPFSVLFRVHCFSGLSTYTFFPVSFSHLCLLFLRRILSTWRSDFSNALNVVLPPPSLFFPPGPSLFFPTNCLTGLLTPPPPISRADPVHGFRRYPLFLGPFFFWTFFIRPQFFFF